MYILDGRIRFSPNARSLSSCSGDQQNFLTKNETGLLEALISGTIAKEELIDQVWGVRGVIVTDSSYYKTLHTLRARLQSFGMPEIGIKTIHRVGAALSCAVAPLDEQHLAPLDVDIDSNNSIIPDSSDVVPAPSLPAKPPAVKSLPVASPVVEKNEQENTVYACEQLIGQPEIMQLLQKHAGTTEILRLSWLILLVASIVIFFLPHPGKYQQGEPIKLKEFVGHRFHVEPGDSLSGVALREKIQFSLPDKGISDDVFNVEKSSPFLISCQRFVESQHLICKNHLLV